MGIFYCLKDSTTSNNTLILPAASLFEKITTYLHHMCTAKEKQHSDSVRNKNLCPRDPSRYDAVRLLLRAQVFHANTESMQYFLCVILSTCKNTQQFSRVIYLFQLTGETYIFNNSYSLDCGPKSLCHRRHNETWIPIDL